MQFELYCFSGLSVMYNFNWGSHSKKAQIQILISLSQPIIEIYSSVHAQASLLREGHFLFKRI